jgi:hypothetical protein
LIDVTQDFFQNSAEFSKASIGILAQGEILLQSSDNELTTLNLQLQTTSETFGKKKKQSNQPVH